MQRSEIEARLIDLLVEELGIERARITPEAALADDLELDSLGQVELILALEDAFGVSIPDEEAEGMTTVSRVVDLVMEKLGG